MLIRLRGAGCLPCQVLVQLELLLRGAGGGAVAHLGCLDLRLGALAQIFPCVLGTFEEGSIFVAEAGGAWMVRTRAIGFVHDEGPRWKVKLLETNAYFIVIDGDGNGVGHCGDLSRAARRSDVIEAGS